MWGTLLTIVLLVVAATPAAAPAGLQGALDVDYARSHIVAKLSKAGFLRFLGHEHGVVPATWSATVVFDERSLETSHISVQVDAPQLLIDTERARRLAGVDPDGPDDEETAEIRAKMLSGEQLDVERFPLIRFETTRLQLHDSKLRMDGNLSLHGVSRRIEIETDLVEEDTGYAVSGAFEIELRDFDIEPVSIGGVVKVANEVRISFEIHVVHAPGRKRPAAGPGAGTPQPRHAARRHRLGALTAAGGSSMPWGESCPRRRSERPVA